MDNPKTRIVGFSTLTPQGKKPEWKLYDYELAKRDLLNHFYTRKGERVMLPEYGTIIWDKIMEPFTAALRELIVWDVRRVINSDPRFSVQDITVTEYQHGLKITVKLDYLPAGSAEVLSLDYDRRLAER